MLFGGETAQSYYEEGLTAAMKGDLPLAARRFTRAIELDAQLYNARHQLGKCLLRMGRPAEALEQLQTASRHLPYLAAPRVDTGDALLLQGKIEEARQQFAAALEIKSEDPRAIMGLARCAAAKEQWGTVVGLTQHALEQGHTHFDAHYLLAYGADKCDMPEIAMGNYTKAAAIIEQSIEANPEQATGYYLRGKICFAQENFSAALDDFDVALEKADKAAHYAAYSEHFSLLDILCMKGLCLQRLSRIGEAKAVGEEIVGLAPDSPTGQTLAALDGDETRKEGE